ncbi:MAG: PQQ-binding-like beta-propeller repeat protein, partial [Pseudomonadota bacterium]
MRRPFPSFLHLLTLLGISMSLIACSSNPMGRIFDRDGDEEVVEEEAQDDRVSVLALQQALTPNPRFIGQTLEVPPAFANNQWAQPGGEADHVMHHLSLAENLDRAWQARIGKGGQKRSPLTAPPVIADGRAYTVDTEAKVSAFDALSGDLLWQADLTPDLTDGPKRKFWQIRRGLTASEIGFGGGVAYDDDMVFMVSGFGIAAAMHAATGDVLWQAELMAPVRNPPTAANGKVFVVTTANQIVALSQETGQTLWSHESFEENARFLSNGSPAVQAGVVIAPFSSGEVVAL